MITGPNHYRAAEALEMHHNDSGVTPEVASLILQAAQVRATLALTAAIIDASPASLIQNGRAWAEALGRPGDDV